MAEKRYTNVVEMMRDLGDDSAFADGLAHDLARKQLIKKLVALRAARGLTQQDVAKKIGLSQGRISKVETSSDADLTFGTLVSYSDALSLRIEITFVAKDATAVDRVKHHAFTIKRLTDHLAHLCLSDETIAKGVSRFFCEAAFNLLHMLQDSAKKLPLPPEEAFPPMVIETCGVDVPDEEEEHKASRPLCHSR